MLIFNEVVPYSCPAHHVWDLVHFNDNVNIRIGTRTQGSKGSQGITSCFKWPRRRNGRTAAIQPYDLDLDDVKFQQSCAGLGCCSIPDKVECRRVDFSADPHFRTTVLLIFLACCVLLPFSIASCQSHCICLALR